MKDLIVEPFNKLQFKQRLDNILLRFIRSKALSWHWKTFLHLRIVAYISPVRIQSNLGTITKIIILSLKLRCLTSRF